MILLVSFPFLLSFAMTINKARDDRISVWTKFGKSLLITWRIVCGLLTHQKTFDLFVYTLEVKTTNIVYPKALQ